jgi:hypothetical protein
MRITFTLLAFCASLLYSTHSTAQVERVIYQYLYISDSTNLLHFRLNDSFEVISWQHENKIMIETSARLDNGSMDLLAIMIRDGRYNYTFNNDVPAVSTLKHVDEARPLLKNKGLMCKETVKLKIYIPSIFEKTSEFDYSRPSEALIASGGK